MLVNNRRKMLKGIPQRLHPCHLCSASYFHRGSLLFHLDVHHEAQKQAELRKVFSNLSTQSKVITSSKMTVINTNNAITNPAVYQPYNKGYTFERSLGKHLKPCNNDRSQEVKTSNENKGQNLVPSFALMRPNKRLSPFKTILKSIEPFVYQETENGITRIEDDAEKQNVRPKFEHPTSQFSFEKTNAMKESESIKTCISSEEQMDVFENKDETLKTTVCQPCNRDYIFEGSLAKHLIQCPNKSPNQTSPKNKTEMHPIIGHTYMKLSENNKPKTNCTTEKVRFINRTLSEEPLIKRYFPNETNNTKLRTVDSLQIKVEMSKSKSRENLNINQNANRNNHVLRKDDLLQENYLDKKDMNVMADPSTTKTLKYLIPIFVKEIQKVSNEIAKPEKVNEHNRINNNSAFCKLCNRDYIYKSDLVKHLSKCKHTNSPKQNPKIKISTFRGNPWLSSPSSKTSLKGSTRRYLEQSNKEN